MSHDVSQTRNRMFILGGLGISLLVAVFLSPFASQNPDGLDRVSEDLKFNTKETKEKLAHKLPFYTVFDEYKVRGVPESVATPLAGLAGTLCTFGLAWGIGKLMVSKSAEPENTSQTES